MATKITKKAPALRRAGEARAQGPTLTDYAGVLVLIQQTSDVQEVSTPHGEASVLNVRLLDCDNDADGWVTDVSVWGKVLIPEIQSMGRDVFAAVVGKGKASPGKSAPWVLEDPSDEQIAKASAALEANPLS